ncbi:hypothetical protein PR202_ga14903 [Eleusine coracana subsp. coracana]|uniref:Uncharacterized protein n=1 Tax=Eleusine coracana subsp. coracana TaxID=191504 RepID=A0AAV5CHW9_ELECO|nr:hypothetical protein PR202_ga14903 [Eleusine coracana subsp. coracana]
METARTASRLGSHPPRTGRGKRRPPAARTVDGELVLLLDGSGCASYSTGAVEGRTRWLGPATRPACSVACLQLICVAAPLLARLSRPAHEARPPYLLRSRMRCFAPLLLPCAAK